jgi:restriction endonuclease S subunit
MKAFKPSSNLDKNKVFILNRSGLDQRFDPQYYHFERRLQIENLRNSGHKLLPLIEVAEFSKNLLTSNPNNLPYLGLEDIESNTGVYLGNSEKGGFGTALRFTKGDVLFPKLRPYLNKVHFAEFDGVCSTEFTVLKSRSMNSKFLSAYLRSPIVLNQVKHMMSGNTLPRLQTEDVRSLLAPIPSKEIQEKVVSLMDEAYSQKKRNEAEAEKLLAGIDDYLMKALGIELPPQQENTLKSRMFFTNLREVSENRFDPFYHQKWFSELEQSLSKGFYNNTKLGNVCDLQNGFAFKSADYVEKSETLNIRMSNIRSNNVFDPEYNPQYLPNSYSVTYKDYLLHDGDLVIAMTDMASSPKILGVPTMISGLNGRKFLLNQRMGRLFDFDSNEISIDYLRFILSTNLIKAFYNKLGARGVQINISREQILSARIPLPPLSKQQEIANHITSIRKQAQELKDQTKSTLEQANKKIEEILLGN